MPAIARRLVILLAVAGAALAEDAADALPPTPPANTVLTARVEGPGRIVLGETTRFDVVLRNVSDHEISIVQAGDGSDVGWRTPFVGWAVVRDGSKAKFPLDVPKADGLRCGNMNALKRAEIHRLKPGDALALDAWAGQPDFPEPGTYGVRFYYRNVPEHPWTGGDLGGPADAEALRALHASTPCFAVSDEVQVVVEPGPAAAPPAGPAGR